MLRKTILPLSLFLLTLCNIRVLAQQFSADVVHLKPASAAAAKIFVRGDKVRFETAGAQKRTVVVLDLRQQTGFMEIPESQTSTVLRPQQISPAMPLFHPADPENACPAWDLLIHKPGTCTKAGDETLNGRPTVKYKGTARNGDTGWAWVDRKLSFVVKWEGQSNVLELRNIKEGPQPAGLFEATTGFQRMDQSSPREKAMPKKPSKSDSAPKKPLE